MDDYKIIPMKTIAKHLNNRIFSDYYYRLMLLARSVFEWKNLPDGISEKWIEKYLFSYGKCMFYKDKTLGFMVSKVVENGALNYYDEPTTLRPSATGYMSCRDYENHKDCVLIRNNDDMIPTAPTIQLYALNLAEIQRTIDTNIRLQKTSAILQGSNKQMLSLKQVYKAWDGNEPVIFADKNFDLGSINVIKTDAPIVFDKLQIHKHSVWNEVMTFLGINNANMDKRERLVDDEVQANNEQIELSASVMLKARQEAAEEINKLFNLKGDKAVSVEIRSSIKLNEDLLDGNEYINDKGDKEGII